MSALFTIDQSGKPAGILDRARRDLSLGTITVNCPDSHTTYKWEVTSEPQGTPAVITNDTAQSTDIVLSEAGPYLIRLTVDDGLSTKDVSERLASIAWGGFTLPALNETNQDNSQSPYDGSRGTYDKLDALYKAMGSGGTRKAAVIDYVDCTAPPPTEVLGDRYILDTTSGTVHPDWDGASKNDIVDFNGSLWDAETPEEGWVTYVDAIDKDALFVVDATSQWEFHSPGGELTPEGYIFVDADNGTDSTGDGSASNPYKTLAYAASTVAAPVTYAEFDTPTVFVVYGTHSDPVTMPYRRNIVITGGPAVISGKITWNYDIDYWFGATPITSYTSSLVVAPPADGLISVHDIEGKNEVDKDTASFRYLIMQGVYLYGNILNLESGNTTAGRQTGELLLFMNKCFSQITATKHIGGERESTVPGENSVVLFVAESELTHTVCGMSSFRKCSDTNFYSVDYSINPVTGLASYAGKIGGTQFGCKGCQFPTGAKVGWDGVTGSAPGDIPLDANTYQNLLDKGAQFDNFASGKGYILLDTGTGVDNKETGLVGNLRPHTTGDSDNVRKALVQFDTFYGAGDSTIIVKRGANDVESADNLLAAYTWAKALTPGGNPIGKDNRVVVVVPPGVYDLGTQQLLLDTVGIDLVGVPLANENLGDSNPSLPSVQLYSNGVSSDPLIKITASNVKMEGFRVRTGASRTGAGIELATDFQQGALSNIEFNVSSGIAVDGSDTQTNGFFVNIAASGHEFLPGGDVRGEFRFVVAGSNSFAGNNSTRASVFSGDAFRCTGGDGCFGSSSFGNGTFSGKAESCVVGGSSFGYSNAASSTGEVSSTAELLGCEAGNQSFGYSDSENGTFAGNARNCEGGNYCFGSTGAGATKGGIVAATADLRYCNAGHYSFGGSDNPTENDQFYGTAYLCNGTLNCFGTNGDFAGVCFICGCAGYAFGGPNGTTSQANKVLAQCNVRVQMNSIGMRDGLQVVQGVFVLDDSMTEGAFQVTDSLTEPPRLSYVEIRTPSSVTYSVDSDGGANDVKMAFCALTKDIDPNLTNLIGSGNNVVDADFR